MKWSWKELKLANMLVWWTLFWFSIDVHWAHLMYSPFHGFLCMVYVIPWRLGLLLVAGRTLYLTAPTICDTSDMLTHASQILLSQWHPGYLMTTAIWEERGFPRGPQTLVIKPHWGEKRTLVGSPKIRVLIEIHCNTICWTLWYKPNWYVFCVRGSQNCFLSATVLVVGFFCCLSSG